MASKTNARASVIAPAATSWSPIWWGVSPAEITITIAVASSALTAVRLGPNSPLMMSEMKGSFWAVGFSAAQPTMPLTTIGPVSDTQLTLPTHREVYYAE